MSAVLRPETDVFMSVRQVAEYLHLNEKKIYALVNEGAIPATKVTGKWMFPRELIDRWMLDSAHGGLLTDRLVIAGSDDPHISYGAAEFIAAEEMHRDRGYWWSPDGTALLTTRVDTSGVNVWHIAAPIDPRSNRPVSFSARILARISGASRPDASNR